jgi:hypothetical protein
MAALIGLPQRFAWAGNATTAPKVLPSPVGDIKTLTPAVELTNADTVGDKLKLKSRSAMVND